MSAKILKHCINIRLKLSLYTAGTGIIQYNQKTGLFQPSTIFLLHTKFISQVGFVYNLVLLHFLWETIDFNDYENFAGSMLGVAEVATIYISIFIKSRVLRYSKEFCNNLNNHFELLEKIEDLRKRATITPAAPRFKKAEWLITALALVTLFFGLALVPAFCVLAMEPNHRMFLYMFEFDIALRPQSLPALIFLFVCVMDISTFLFVVVIGGLIHIMIAPYIFIGLSPNRVNSRGIIQTDQSVRVSYKLETTSFGILDENEVVKFARHLQLLNDQLNFVYACLEISSHHALVLVVFVCTSFMFIRAWETILQAGYAMVVLAICGILAGLAAEYIESFFIGTLVDATKYFVGKGKALPLQNSVYRKFIRSFPKYLTFKIAEPFFNITNETFLEFLDQCFNFLVTLLTFNV